MDLVMLGSVFAAGLVAGYLLAVLTRRKSVAPAPVASKAAAPARNWWEERKLLTGTQLQILQFMEGTRRATITRLQEKFSFIPDRELFYRLEQICLMGFIARAREGGEIVYALNDEYAGTIEEDKTVILS